MSHSFSVIGLVAAIVQVVVIVAGAPLMIGCMRQTRARLEGRVGPGVLQPWREIRKMMRKDRISPNGTSEPFRLAPLVLMATTVVVALLSPLITTRSPLDPIADLFAIIALLTLGTVSLILAAIDTGTAFGGLGASRETMIAALVEPTLLVSAFALSVRVGSTNLSDIVAGTIKDPASTLSPVSLFALVAFALAIMAECGRVPIDNPGTSLELTMIHKAMTLEFAGPNMAMIELANWMRLAVFLSLLGSLFIPVGVTTSAGLSLTIIATLVWIVKVAILAIGLAITEVFIAKLRLFRIPEVLAGSFLLALVAVGASFFLA